MDQPEERCANQNRAEGIDARPEGIIFPVEDNVNQSVIFRGEIIPAHVEAKVNHPVHLWDQDVPQLELVGYQELVQHLGAGTRNKGKQQRRGELASVP